MSEYRLVYSKLQRWTIERKTRRWWFGPVTWEREGFFYGTKEEAQEFINRYPIMLYKQSVW